MNGPYLIVHYPNGLRVTCNAENMRAVVVENFDYTDMYGYPYHWDRGEVVGYTMLGLQRELFLDDKMGGEVQLIVADELYLRTEMELQLGTPPEAAYEFVTEPVFKDIGISL